MGRRIHIDNVLGLENPTLRNFDETSRDLLWNCGCRVYAHPGPDQKQWIQERIEGIHNKTAFSPLGKETLLVRLTEAETFENFLNTKYPGTKRFGLDGGEASSRPGTSLEEG